MELLRTDQAELEVVGGTKESNLMRNLEILHSDFLYLSCQFSYFWCYQYSLYCKKCLYKYENFMLLIYSVMLVVINVSTVYCWYFSLGHMMVHTELRLFLSKKITASTPPMCCTIWCSLLVCVCVCFSVPPPRLNLSFDREECISMIWCKIVRFRLLFCFHSIFSSVIICIS